MVDYREEVMEARNSRNGVPVLANRSQAHAAVILENLFIAAQTSVEIVSEKLLDKVYDDDVVLTAARTFLEKPGVKIDILVESDFDKTRPFIKLLGEFPDSVEINSVPPEVSATYSYNFCVADNDCYRFEKNRSEYEATIQFGNSANASKMRRAFAEIKALVFKRRHAGVTPS